MAQGKGWNETSDKEPRMTFPDLSKGKNKIRSVLSSEEHNDLCSER